ncbi:MAG: sigma-70 family RNA polymerase sigma factor [Saccharofermentanales bacterium]|jgi:RNA polymerase sigma factor (sigma-70 family)
MYDIDLLYREYSKDIYAHLLYLTHDETLSQDLLQETFLQAIKSISTFKGNSSIKTWLFSIARYSWIAHLRKNKIIFSNEDISNVVLSVDLDKDLKNKDLIARIYEIIDESDSKTKTIVLMRLDGYSYNEISNKLEISESSARVIDFRAKRKIREILEKEELL